MVATKGAMVRLAVPPLKVWGAPSGEPLTSNWTVPVGVPAPCALALATVAVKVRPEPVFRVAPVTASVVLVASALTVCLTVVAVLAANVLLAGA